MELITGMHPVCISKILSMRKILFLWVACSFFSLQAQKQAEVNLELHDGNIIKGTAAFNDVDLTTPYGKLLIPVAKVSGIKIGYGRDKAATEKAMAQIKILNTSNNEDVRKNAYNELLKMGVKAIAAFEDFLNDPKNMTETESTSEFTVENAYEEIKSANNIGDMSSPDDIITIDNMYTMGGAYNFTKLDIKTEYGNLSIPKEKIKSIDVFVSSGDGKGDMMFKLMANKHISGNQNGGWLKTGITLKSGQKFSIVSSGEITLASLSNGVYKPSGAVKSSGSEYGDEYDASSGSGGNYPTYGQVVYRIGDNSYEALKAGAKFSGTAKNSGMLYISIYETVYNAGNKGFYNVKISTSK